MNKEERGNEAFLAIGKFIQEFSLMEFALRLLFLTELKPDWRFGEVLLYSYDLAHLCTVTKRIVSISRNEENSREIHRLIDQVHQMNAERIKVVHGLWVADFFGGALSYFPRSKLQSVELRDQRKHLEQLSKKVSKLAEAILNQIDWGVPKRPKRHRRKNRASG